MRKLPNPFACQTYLRFLPWTIFSRFCRISLFVAGQEKNNGYDGGDNFFHISLPFLKNDRAFLPRLKINDFNRHSFMASND